MKYTCTQRDKRKLIKKVIGKSIYLPIKMAKNCRYTKKELIDTILFSVANNISVEYGSKRMKEMRMKVPSGDDVFHHLDKLKTKEVLSAFYNVNSDALKRERNRRKRALCAIDVHKIPYTMERIETL